MAEESTPLVTKRLFNQHDLIIAEAFVGNNLHRIKIFDLFHQLNTSLEGLVTTEVITKREKYGLHCVTPPISLPPVLCCILPCVAVSASMQKYHECIADSALVKRNGKWIRIDSISLVPGDIVRLNIGERTPADMRIFKSEHCLFDASSVMGKYIKVAVDFNNIPDNYLDSPNIAFMGYLCLEGECTGVVIATGDDTLLGHLIHHKQWPIA